MATDFPAIETLLPHAGSMVLLAAVEEHTEERTVCSVEIDRLELFRAGDGSVGCWIGLEFMAQCIAAHAGLLAKARGEVPRPGFLLGSRRVTFPVSRYNSGGTLRVSAARIWGGTVGMVSFDCSISGDEDRLLAEARLNCFLPDEGEGLI